MSDGPDLRDEVVAVVPVRILKDKVKTDFEEYMFFHGSDNEDNEISVIFPMYESTKEVLDILKACGVEFDTVTGLWQE